MTPQAAAWLMVLVAISILASMAGCAKPQVASPTVSPPASVLPPVMSPESEPAPPGAEKAPLPPLTIVRVLEEELPGGKRSVKLVVRGEEDEEAVERLLQDYVDRNRREGEELWVAVFFEGMDLQSIEYAFAVAKPGRRPYITVRESLQTYR